MTSFLKKTTVGALVALSLPSLVLGFQTADAAAPETAEKKKEEKGGGSFGSSGGKKEEATTEPATKLEMGRAELELGRSEDDFDALRHARSRHHSARRTPSLVRNHRHVRQIEPEAYDEEDDAVTRPSAHAHKHQKVQDALAEEDEYDAPKEQYQAHARPHSHKKHHGVVEEEEYAEEPRHHHKSSMMEVSASGHTSGHAAHHAREADENSEEDAKEEKVADAPKKSKADTDDDSN